MKKVVFVLGLVIEKLVGHIELDGVQLRHRKRRKIFGNVMNP